MDSPYHPQLTPWHFPLQVLRCPPDAAPLVVKAAFRRVSMLVHPDKNRSKDASQAMQAVTAAFRSLYLDSGLPRRKPPQPPAAAAKTQAQSAPPTRGRRPYMARRTSSNSSSAASRCTPSLACFYGFAPLSFSLTLCMCSPFMYGLLSPLSSTHMPTLLSACQPAAPFVSSLTLHACPAIRSQPYMSHLKITGLSSF